MAEIKTENNSSLAETTPETVSDSDTTGLFGRPINLPSGTSATTCPPLDPALVGGSAKDDTEVQELQEMAAEDIETETTVKKIEKTSLNVDVNSIEALYALQVKLLGHEAVLTMSRTKILICGFRGLGQDIARKTILAGIKILTIHDTNEDLSTHSMILDSHVALHTDSLSEDFLKKFEVIILTDSNLEEQSSIGDIAHRNRISLIIADCKGLFGQVFCDFGEDFSFDDMKVDQPLSAMIASVSKEKEGIITCFENSKHDFGNNDYVTFSDIEGMIELNACEPRKVLVLGPYTFGIGDTSNFSDYIRGGVATQVNMPQKVSFKCFKDAVADPKFMTSDFAWVTHPPQLHLAFQSLHMFKKINNRLPKVQDEEDAKQFLSIVISLNATSNVPVEPDEGLMQDFPFYCEDDLFPLQTVIGDITTQEVIKACCGKFHPIVQWLYLDALQCIPKEWCAKRHLDEPVQIVFEDLIAVFGSDFQINLAELQNFMVKRHKIILTRKTLPALIIDGVCTSVGNMTQAQLRRFIPMILKSSTGRSKPGYGKESTRPAWWPKDVPWASIYRDSRTDEAKKKVSFTATLRQIVEACYVYHNREDLLTHNHNDTKTKTDSSQLLSSAITGAQDDTKDSGCTKACLRCKIKFKTLEAANKHMDEVHH